MTTNAEHDPTVEEQRRNVLLEVSNTMVRLFKNQFGRGPTKTRTVWAGPDALMCILDDTLTPAERRMVKLGEHQRLRETRLIFQYSSIEEFCRPVEKITGRTLRAFHSSTDTEVNGQSVEVFIFHPEGYDGPSRIELAAA
jgi:uncharacterized protein YbcI